MTQEQLENKIKQAAEDALVQLYIHHPELVLDSVAKVACKSMFAAGCEFGAAQLQELINES